MTLIDGRWDVATNEGRDAFIEHLAELGILTLRDDDCMQVTEKGAAVYSFLRFMYQASTRALQTAMQELGEAIGFNIERLDTGIPGLSAFEVSPRDDDALRN